MEKRFLAVDLGAGSGRAIVGTLTQATLHLREVHRFPNEPVTLGDTVYWDLPRLFAEILRGIELAADACDGHLDGIAVDSWGVDFCLLDSSGAPLALPVHYRDGRTEGMMAEVFKTVPQAEVFAETGVQFLELNTLYQLAALKRRSPELLGVADKLLLIADLVHYFLTGRAVQEATLASTTQLWNPATRSWSPRLMEALGLDSRILPDVVPPGTVVGPVLDEIARRCGLKSPPPVIAGASHDTAAAVAAVPACDAAGPWGFLSSGTWSLLGVELPGPMVSPEVLDNDFTNEAGVAGTTRFLRNMNGLFLLEECRKHWARGGEEVDHDTLMQEATGAPCTSFVLPHHPSFFAPRDAPAAIRTFCRETGQAVPESRGEISRCILESLALAYGSVADSLAQLTGRSLAHLHLVGGGSRNHLLNQLTANALNIPVHAGPAEATATGNVLLQAMAREDVGSLEELRDIVRRSSEVVDFLPAETARWTAKRQVYLDLAANP